MNSNEPTKQWSDLIGPDAGIVCADLFLQQIRWSGTPRDESHAQQMRMLRRVLSLHLQGPDRGAGPLVSNDGENVNVFASDDLDAMLELIEHPGLHTDLRARLIDVLFLRKHGHAEIWRTAPRAYLTAATVIAEKGKLAEVPERLERAVALNKFFKDSDAERALGDYVDRILNEAVSELPSPAHLALVRVQRSLPGVDLRRQAEMCERWAIRCESERVFLPFTREVWKTCAESFAKCKLVDEANRARRSAAETYVAEADAAKSSTHMPKSLEAGFLQQGIVALRRVPGTRERCDELHKRMLAVQSEVPNEYGRFAGPTISVAAEATRAIELVTGRPLKDALFRLACIARLPNRDEIRTFALESAKTFSLARMLPRTETDEYGRVVRKSPGMEIGALDENAPGILSAMHDHARIHRAYVVQALVDPARERIAAEQAVDVESLARIVEDSPFIPSDRVASFAFGLHAGLHGNTLVAGHLLVPQLEQAIRQIVAANGGVVSKLDDEGLQEWTLLGGLLEAPELQRVCGNDLVFALRGVLGREGSNIRNDVSHGFKSDHQFASTDMMYLWWLTLHLCLVPVMMASGLRSAESDETAATTGEEAVSE